MKKKLFIILAIIASLFLFVACDNTKPPVDPTEPTPSESGDPSGNTEPDPDPDPSGNTDPEPEVIVYRGAVLAEGEYGKTYLQSIKLATGADNISYALKADNILPNGLELIDGEISGTPTKVGLFEFVIVATAPEAISAEATFTINVPAASLDYEGKTLVEGKIGDNYSQRVDLASGSDYLTYSLKEGSLLPEGLSFAEGIISGVPEEVGLFEFTIVVDADDAEEPIEALFTINIPKIVLSYEGKELNKGIVGDQYSENLESETQSNVTTYTLKTGEVLPPGLSFNEGVISGEPTTVGTYEFVIVADAIDAVAPVEATFTINVLQEGSRVILSYEDANLPNAIFQTPYQGRIDSALGSSLITYELKAGSTLPEGLVLTDKTITGSATTPGEYTFTIVADASNAEAPVEATFTLVVTKKLIAYEGSSLSKGKVGVSFSAYIGNATGSDSITYQLKAGSTLPNGLNLVDTIINGTPTLAGTYTFVIVADAEDAEEAVEATFTIEIAKASLRYQASPLVDGKEEDPYTSNIDTATGSANIVYQLKAGSSLPAGLTLENGVISGVPTVAGTYSFVIVADADDAEAPVEATFNLVIIETVVGPKEYIFEAEYVDFTDQRGSGWSNTQVEWGMVMGDGVETPTSNGMYVAYFTPPFATLVFPFTAEKAGTGTLIFSMVTEYSKEFFGQLGMLLDPSILELKINGIDIEYEIFIRGENQPTIAFEEYIFLEEFAIIAGLNTIEITILENDYFPGRTGGGPNVDYMKIISNLDLVMNLFVDNIDDLKDLRGY